MYTPKRRLVSLAIVGALLTGGFVSVASVAQAAPDQIIGDLTITTAGSPTANGTLTKQPVIDSQTTTIGCPVGFRMKGNTVIAQNDVVLGGFSSTWDSAVPNTYGNGGINGQPVDLNQVDSVVYNSTRPISAIPNIATTLVPGDFEMRRYCWQDEFNIDYTVDKYFVSKTLTLDAAGNWAVKAPVAAGPAGIVVPFTAASNSETGQISLTATVQKSATDATVATDAAGKVEFYNTVGGAKVGEGNVTAGVATWTSTQLVSGTYSYTAKFISTDPSKYLSSEMTAAQTVEHSFTGVYEGTPTDVNITVAIPASVSNNGLKLTVANTAVALGKATQTAGNFVASGALGTVTVADARQTKNAWNLNGKVTEFVNTTTPANKIPAGALGWAPSIVTTESAATPGAVVAPGAAGLGSSSILAQAPASTTAGTLTTVTNATLNFSVPATGSVAPGTYGAKLTLTLI
jgi:hypothetical protein